MPLCSIQHISYIHVHWHIVYKYIYSTSITHLQVKHLLQLQPITSHQHEIQKMSDSTSAWTTKFRVPWHRTYRILSLNLLVPKMYQNVFLSTQPVSSSFLMRFSGLPPLFLFLLIKKNNVFLEKTPPGDISPLPYKPKNHRILPSSSWGWPAQLGANASVGSGGESNSPASRQAELNAWGNLGNPKNHGRGPPQRADDDMTFRDWLLMIIVEIRWN